jgi:prophage regulatory protein
MRLIDFKSLGPVKGINYSRDHLRRKWKAGEFPKPVRVSEHRIGWIEAEVDAWLDAKERARDVPPTEPAEVAPDG